MQNFHWKNGKTTVASLTISLILSALILEARGDTPPGDRIRMCVEFDDLPDNGVKSDGLVVSGPDYCDHEDPDVDAYSVGGFALSTQHDNNANGAGVRKLWLSFQNPIATYLPALVPVTGTYDALLYLNSENNAEGTSTGNTIPGGVLTMAASEQQHMCVVIEFREGVNYYPRYALQFGRVSNKDTGPRTPLLLTALADSIDPDTYADSWRLETTSISTGQEGWAYLTKTTQVGRKLVHQKVGIFKMPFGLVFEKK